MSLGVYKYLSLHYVYTELHQMIADLNSVATQPMAKFVL